MIEKKELNKFYIELQEEIKTTLVSAEEGSNPEQIFTDYILSILEEHGETENSRACYDEKITKRGTEHKINGYALYENYETLDLFITIYNSSESIEPIAKTEVDKALNRLAKFFRNAVYRDYINEIEESSEIFDLAQTLANTTQVKEILSRVNIFMITNFEVKSEIEKNGKIAGYPVFYRIIDIHQIHKLSEDEGLPIEIDFGKRGVSVPSIEDLNKNDDYQTYLAIMPGKALAEVYEQYGPRLLEQNVRSFLQFTGKINKGIRKTIVEEPHMFLAFNNGIAATADDVEMVDLPDNRGKAISYIKNLQIVNGGQTTASIFHTWKKDKVDISRIFVQLKLSIIKDRNNFSDIVGRIAEYSNTQNKISASDLSSNREYHVVLERLSRTIWAPPKDGENHRTRWFYERARGQHKNERNRHGITPAKKRQFDKQNPKNQVITKESLAKFINSYKEVYSGNNLVIGPHIVVRGNQKNYALFLNYNFKERPDNIFFEDSVALAILFKASEKVYGKKPNSIGDMRYIVVPYSIAWLGYKTNYSLDLYKIWSKQDISDNLKTKLYHIMTSVERWIKDNAPGSLYGEWAKRKDCWISIKSEDFDISMDDIKSDLAAKSNSGRKRVSDEETKEAEINEESERIRSIHPDIWKKVEKWGRESKKLSHYEQNVSSGIAKAVKEKRKLKDYQINRGKIILDKALNEAPELFSNMEELFSEDNNTYDNVITLTLLKKVSEWNEQVKKLESHEHEVVRDFAQKGELPKGRSRRAIDIIVKKARKAGFKG